MTTDKIADAINRLVTANKAKKPTAVLPYSKFIESILSVLKREGFVAGAKTLKAENKEILRGIEVELVYTDGKPRIAGVKRLSIPSKRKYVGWDEARPVKQGYGRLFLSTPRGVMTDKEARKEKVGGEALFTIW
jgi:small subunit ribosomal protein S8